jgi:hypothetical protein
VQIAIDQAKHPNSQVLDTPTLLDYNEALYGNTEDIRRIIYSDIHRAIKHYSDENINAQQIKALRSMLDSTTNKRNNDTFVTKWKDMVINAI